MFTFRIVGITPKELVHETVHTVLVAMFATGLHHILVPPSNDHHPPQQVARTESEVDDMPKFETVSYHTTSL